MNGVACAVEVRSIGAATNIVGLHLLERSRPIQRTTPWSRPRSSVLSGLHQRWRNTCAIIWFSGGSTTAF